MSMANSNFRLSQFESVSWRFGADDAEVPESPAITPGCMSGVNSGINENGSPIIDGITYGVHYDYTSYPAWNGNLDSPQDEPPFGLENIAAMTNQIREVLGFQADVATSVFELSMSQLDSRASRLGPRAASESLHEDYISGAQANFRKWYFASQMDQIDRKHSQTHRIQPVQSMPKSSISPQNSDSIFDFGTNSPKNESIKPDMLNFDVGNEFIIDNDHGNEEDDTLQNTEAAWGLHFMTTSDAERLIDLLIYLFCWSESNQIRFMPELLAFIVKCARDYYQTRFPAYPQVARNTPDLQMNFYLNKIITPIYEKYRSFNYEQISSGDWIRQEGDHSDFIGYDDINQSFWYREGMQRVKIRESAGANSVDEYGDGYVSLIDTRPEDWYLKSTEVPWEIPFSKTYIESRSWSHNVTNFSRIWIMHVSVFWFYTAFNTPSLYTIGYNYMNPSPPCTFVRWTIMAFGGSFGPIITLIGLIGEWRFVPRQYPGAKPISIRVIAVCFLILLSAVPAICNLVMNPWVPAIDMDLMPANIISFILFSLAIAYAAYFSFQPLEDIFGSTKIGLTRKQSDKIQRKYLANRLFTASFPRRDSHGEILSWLMCVLIFAAKFTESYFFLTLSVRDPLRELGIMDVQDKCVGDKYLGGFLCRSYPNIILAAIIVTDMTLFFSDTYLWYVISNTLISVSLAFEQGTSVWTPWRNIYSQLPRRLSTKLLATNRDAKHEGSRAHSICSIWNSIIENMQRNNLLNREQARRLMCVNSMTQEPQYFTVGEDTKTRRESSSSSSAAYRRISFFAQSLSTTMQPPVRVTDMPAFTVLIPHYNEKMILKSSETIKAETGAKITVLEYLQRSYPCEWENFTQALHDQNKINKTGMTYQFGDSSGSTCSSSPGTISKSSVATSSSVQRPASSMKSSISSRSASTTMTEKSHHIAIQKSGFSTLDPNDTEKTRLWCSQRTQTLYRTLRGFSNYTDALKILHCAEEHTTENVVDYGSEKAMQHVNEICRRKFRLLVAMQNYASFDTPESQEVETISAYVPELKVTYVEREPETGDYYSCLFDSSSQLLSSGRRKPKSRIKSSGNPILGDGKSDNQNTALPYYRGEYIQLVDANQDNYSEECSKIRNVLKEFETPQNRSPVASAPVCPPFDMESQIGYFSSGYTVLNPGPPPVAIVGAREYIFSENIGILGDVAAGKEQTFGTLFSRTLAKIGAKLHYGHPDFSNAIFMTTRGGVSKGQRGLHLNEDIYAGMTTVLRGGQIRHAEYFQCGKGRDLGFVSILNFTTKIGAGMAEQMLSREYFYMGTQLPFDRFITFYYAHPGFHLNNVLIMLSLEMSLMVISWTTSIAGSSTVCKYNRRAPSTEPHSPSGCNNVHPLSDWIHRCVVSIFIVFFVSLCPLFFQELTEKGFFKSLGRIARHFCSLSMSFEVFVCRIYARSFWEDMNVGGAKYVGTGRGSATSRSPFHQLYAGYYSEIICGLKAAGILVFATIVSWNPAYLWFWVTTVSLCFSPVLYNPHQFVFTDFFVDYERLLYWFWNANTQMGVLQTDSWTSFNRGVREKLTGVKDRHMSTQSVRPAFKNAIFTKVGSALSGVVCLGMPYLFMTSQKVSRYQEVPHTSGMLRLAIISAIPVAFNIIALLTGLIISLIATAMFRSKRHANVVAFVVHILAVIALIGSWWVLYILENQRFANILLGVMAAAAMHHFSHTLLTVVVVQKQRESFETSDPWWAGRWLVPNWKHALKLPLIIAEEYIVKIMESLEFAYDFLVCHTILVMQTPSSSCPGIDRSHTLFSLWLKPGVTAAARKSAKIQQKRELVKQGRIFCAVFVLVTGALGAIMMVPSYVPSQWLEGVASFFDFI